jgi:hypothetical protein
MPALGTQLESTEYMDPIASDLRYIAADHLSAGEGLLDGTPVVSRADVTLGTLAGALVDPVHRNLCYLVVDHRQRLRHHHYVLPLDLTRFDRGRGALLVDADVTDLREIPLDQFATFSDADLLTAIFSPRAA